MLIKSRNYFLMMLVLILGLVVSLGLNGLVCGAGKLVVYSAGPGGLAKAIKEGFEAKTGIQVELFQSTTGKVLGRLEAEKTNPLADVVVLASWPSAEGLKMAGMTQAYKEIKNGDKFHKNWVDKDGHYFGYSASALGVSYNTLLVKNPPKDWDDFLRPEWRNKINLPDPTLSGSCLDFVSGYINMYNEKGWKFFEGLRRNKAMVSGANKEALNMVITGTKSVVLAGVDYMAYGAKAKGEPVDLFYPASGTVINPRPAMILKEAKNIKNARLFMDYLLSDDAQQMVADALLLPGRSDIRSAKRPNVSEIPVLDYDWNWMTENNTVILKRFNTIFR